MGPAVGTGPVNRGTFPYVKFLLLLFLLLKVERKLLYDVAVCVCCILYVKSCMKVLTVY
jgi:hypothetical protein